MVQFAAILPHDNDAFQAKEVEITGITTDELYRAAWRPCIGGRYVSRIVAIHDGRQTTVYNEGAGWLIEDPIDPAQLAELWARQAAPASVEPLV